MKDEIIKRITAVLSALNAVSVSGRQNLVNLSGSIAVLEEVVDMLNNAAISTSALEDSEKE